MDIILEEGKRYRMRNGYLTGLLKKVSNTTFVADTYESSGDTTLVTHTRSWNGYGSWGFSDDGLDTYLEDIVEVYIENKIDTFNTQQEIWAYLSTGGFVKHEEEGAIILGFSKSGTLSNYGNATNTFWNFANPKDWIKTDKPEPKWYDNIPEQGILCWVDDYYKDKQLITGLKVVIAHEPEKDKPFIVYRSEASGTVSYKYATPATLDDLANYIYECE